MNVVSLLALLAFFTGSSGTPDNRFEWNMVDKIGYARHEGWDEQEALAIQTVSLVQTEAVAPVRRIHAGPLTLEVFVGSRTAHLFHVVDQLSGWSPFCHLQYRRYWEKTYGPLTPEETALLAEHVAIRKRRGWGTLEPIFYTPKNLEAALADPRLGKDDAATERRVFSVFATRIERLVAAEGDASERFAVAMEAKRPELTAFANKAARLFGTKALRLPVYLLANPEDDSIGGGYNGGVLTLEIPRKRDAFPSLLHEVFHGFLEPHKAALDAAARGVDGLDGQTLNEGICYALSPGLFNTSGGNADPLRIQVRADFESGKPLSNAYTRFNRFGLALRPILKDALTDPHATFATVLPRAVDTWRALSELSLAVQPPERPQAQERPRIVSFGPGWQALNDHTWALGYWLVARSHGGEDEYRQTLARFSHGTTVFLLYAQDSLGDLRNMPAAYHDLLPKPVKDIETALARGESIEAEGKARGFRVILLAAPTKEGLKLLITRMKWLDPAP